MSLYVFACGKYGPPLPPSAYAPKELQNVTFALNGDEILVSWMMPTEDRRGKSLQSLDEVILYTRMLPSPTAESVGIDDFKQQQVFYVEGFQAKKESATTLAPGVTANDAPLKKATKSGTLTFKAPEVNQPLQVILAAFNQGGVAGDASNIYQLTRKSDGTLETVSIPTERSPIS